MPQLEHMVTLRLMERVIGGAVCFFSHVITCICVQLQNDYVKIEIFH